MSENDIAARLYMLRARYSDSTTFNSSNDVTEEKKIFTSTGTMRKRHKKIDQTIKLKGNMNIMAKNSGQFMDKENSKISDANELKDTIPNKANVLSSQTENQPPKIVSNFKPIPVGSTVTTPYGTGTVVEVRPESVVPYRVEMSWKALATLTAADVKWKKKLFEMTTEEKLQTGLDHKNMAAQKFSFKEYADACRLYEMAIVYIRQTREESHITTYIAPCYQNIALCKLKLGDWKSCIENAQECIKISPENSKSRFIIGKAQRLSQQFPDAVNTLVDAARISPHNTEIRHELTLAKQAYKEYLDAQRAAYTGAFIANSEESQKSSTTSEAKVVDMELKENDHGSDDGSKSKVVIGVAALTVCLYFAMRWYQKSK